MGCAGAGVGGNAFLGTTADAVLCAAKLFLGVYNKKEELTMQLFRLVYGWAYG
jgi:hypothetical protein